MYHWEIFGDGNGALYISAATRRRNDADGMREQRGLLKPDPHTFRTLAATAAFPDGA